ncbi:MAG: ribosome maturation factor RimM [Clostridiales Family XIII bacterium]|nr:ribosome maturation factor RimM [Clostridiales Family XIII bacterium]
MTGKIRIGKISGVSGLKGEMKLFHYSGERERIAGIDEVFFLSKRNADERIDRSGDASDRGDIDDGSDAGEPKALVRRKVLSMRYRGKTPILLVEGIWTRATAEAFVGADVYVDRSALRPLDEGGYYIEALVGCAVVDEDGERLGEAAGVIDNPANDILRIRPVSGEEFLLPMVDRFVLAVDTDAMVMTVRLPDGLVADAPGREDDVDEMNDVNGVIEQEP